MYGSHEANHISNLILVLIQASSKALPQRPPANAYATLALNEGSYMGCFFSVGMIAQYPTYQVVYEANTLFCNAF